MAARVLTVASGISYTCLVPTSWCRMLAAHYAKKVGGPGGKMGQPIKKVKLEVETDPKRLVQYCCGANIYTTGSDPELKPDSEYPEWLWTLRLDRRPPDLSELDPEDYPYWRRLRKLTLRHKNQLRKVDKLK